MRVLLISDSPYMGGIPAHLLSIAQAFRGHGTIEIVLASLPGKRADASFPERARALGHAVHLLPMRHPFDTGVFASLRALVAAQPIDLVHTHNYRATVIAARAGLPVPHLSTSHGMAVAPGFKLRAYQWASLRAMRHQPRVLACSDFVRRWLLEQGLDPKRVAMVHNAYEAPAPSPAQDLRAEWGLAPERLVLLYAGRLVEGKGLVPLLHAAARLEACTLLVAGDGPLRDELEGLKRQLGLDVRFLGRVDAIDPCYRAADVVALPSAMEALPMTLIEAAAHGKPAVASDRGGISEVVEHEGSGLLVPFGDVAALAAACERLRDPALRRRMGGRALEIWRERFTYARMAERLTREYEGLRP